VVRQTGPVPQSHVYNWGPDDGPVVLALHGLTGHGKRWANFASEHLPEAQVIAPDLRGHGRSPWQPPWTFEHLVDDVAALLDAAGPAIVVGHSFGGAVATHLAARRPELVTGLVLLDPAIGLDPDLALANAGAAAAYSDYTDAAEARSEKLHEAWGELDPALLDAELAEHLVPAGDGRVEWRLSTPAMVTYWSELTRDFVLPPSGLPTVLVQAMRVQPPYVTAAFRSALVDRLGAALTVHEFDCDHMVPLARGADVADIVRTLLRTE
jgi:lipase